jgi:twitching motility protein PilT
MSSKLLESLLDAIVRLDADALVMHVGDKPYVVTTSATTTEYRGPLSWGQVELSSRVLSSEAVLGLLGQLLPDDQQQALEEFGAIEHAIPAPGDAADRFTIVAARSGDDVWLEVRRKPLIPARTFIAGQPDPAESDVEPLPVVVPPPAIAAAVAPAASSPAPAPVLVIEEEGDDDEDGDAGEHDVDEREEVVFELSLDGIAAAPEPEPAPPPDATLQVVPEENQSAPTHDEVDALLAETAATLLAASRRSVPASAAAQPAEVPIVLLDVEPPRVEPQMEPPPAAVASVSVLNAALERPPVPPAPAPNAAAETAPVASAPAPDAPSAPARSQEPEPAAIQVAPSEQRAPERRTDEPRHAVVLPISRSPVRSEPAAEVATVVGASVERVLRVAAARGASTVYVVAQSRPVIRLEGEISVLDGEPVMTAAEIERLVMDLTPARGRDQSRGDGEWTADVAEVGRVRCVTFRDHRGPGVIFRMTPPQAISVEHLALTPEVQALCAQPDGLVLVTGARASGKSTLLTAFVDLINRSRSDHVITIEPEIGFVHESRRSFVSQREVRADGDGAVAAVRSALREDPDVIVIDDLRTPEVAAMALEAAEGGRLVFASVVATSTVSAIEHLIEMFPPDRRAQTQASLAGALRGVVSQVLLRKIRGGRIAAREVLLNTPSVASLFLEGKMFQLPVALDSGRRHGMIPLSDALAALVREGVVHEAEAYRKAFDREGLLAVLKRQGVDTTFAERLA